MEQKCSWHSCNFFSCLARHAKYTVWTDSILKNKLNSREEPRHVRMRDSDRATADENSRSSNFPRHLNASVEGDESRRAGISVFSRNGARNYFRGWGIIRRWERISARCYLDAGRGNPSPRQRNSGYVTGVNPRAVGRGVVHPSAIVCVRVYARARTYMWRWEERAERFMNGMFPRQVWRERHPCVPRVNTIIPTFPFIRSTPTERYDLEKCLWRRHDTRACMRVHVYAFIARPTPLDFLFFTRSPTLREAI